MTLGKNISRLRKEKGLTQEALANALGVTNQAVSKWEQDSCCPDIQLLPRLAELFGCSIDALFGRQIPSAEATYPLPWEDDGVLRAVLFAGRQLILGHPAGERIEFQYEGPALNVHSQFNITCDSVGADVHAGGSVTCDSVYGNISAGGNVTCDEIFGNVQAGGDVRCDHLDSSAPADIHIHFG